jgi:hypothetical protein
LDANKVSDRIAEAGTALVTRSRELFDSAGDNVEEEQAADDAMYALHAPSERVEVAKQMRKTLSKTSLLKLTGDQK